MNDLTNRHYLKQAPSVVNGRFTLTKSESDIVFCLLTEIDKDDEDFKDYMFTKESLEKKLGIKLDTGQLRRTARSLMSKILEIKESNEKWEILSWFSYFKYDYGTITCRFDKSMKPFYLKLKQYILADFRHLIQIESIYSRRIYLFLKEYQKFGMRKFNIEELMDTLQVPKSYRARYNDFKRKVLLQAVKDINRYTDIRIKNLGTAKNPKWFEEHKKIRKVTDVTFHFQKNWDGLKDFISYIRELYTNKDLYYTKDNRLLRCDANGLLYYADNPDEHITKEQAQKYWEYLHDNRERLLCFQPTLFDTIKS